MMEQTGTNPTTEYEDMKRRLANLERIVRAHILKDREVAIISMGRDEDLLGMERTKISRKKALE